MTKETGFNALGKPVPSNRTDAAYKTVKHILPNLTSEEAYAFVAKCAEYIRKDEPFRIVGAVEGLDEDLQKIDVTGRYRLMAVLLTDPKEKTNENN